jgi:hypothetical protein
LAVAAVSAPTPAVSQIPSPQGYVPVAVLVSLVPTTWGVDGSLQLPAPAALQAALEDGAAHHHFEATFAEIGSARPPPGSTRAADALCSWRGPHGFGLVAAVDPPYAEGDEATPLRLLAPSVVAAPATTLGVLAVVRRGCVPFATKARRAQRAGAVACVFVNSSDALFVPHGSPDDPGDDLELPSVCLRRRDGELLLALLDAPAAKPGPAGVPGPRVAVASLQLVRY